MDLIALALTAAGVLLFANLWLAASGASAAFPTCQLGEGSGQCNTPAGGIATDLSEGDPASGQLYVADRSNNRLNVFGPDGVFRFAVGWGVADGVSAAFQKCTVTCFRGIAGTGAGQLNGPARVAVDNSGGPAAHDVYVYDGGNRRVVRFDSAGNFIASFGEAGTGDGQFSGTQAPIAVGGSGIVYVSDGSRVQKFSSTGVYLGAVGLTEPSQAIAVDSVGDIYVIADAAIQKLDAAGTPYGAPFPIDRQVTNRFLAVDPADNLYAVMTEPRLLGGGFYQVVTKYAPDGVRLRRFAYGDREFSMRGLAASALATGSGVLVLAEVFGGSDVEVRHIPEPPLGPLAAEVPPSLVATALSNTKATLQAELNPEGKPTTYHYEVISEADYQAAGQQFGAGTISTEESGVIGSDFVLHVAESQIGCAKPGEEAAEGKCLIPETDYRFRIVATNADGVAETEGQPFTTKAPLEFGQVWSSGVGTDAARISAQLNPFGVPATGYFEYLTEEEFEAEGWGAATRVPSSGLLDFGAAEQFVTRSAALSSLLPGAVYRYRLVATNLLIDEEIPGPAATFRTFRLADGEICPANQAFRVGFGSFLPDCRGYELVTPLEKGSTDVLPLTDATEDVPSVINRSSLLGTRVTYSTNRSFGDAISAPFASQYLAARTGDGWQTTSLSPPRGPLILPVSVTLNTEFKAFSSDLCSGWLRTITDLSLATAAVPGYPNLYRRSNPGAECESPAGDYQAVTTGLPPNGNSKDGGLELQGVAVDGSASIYVAQGKRAPEAPEVAGRQLYLSRSGIQHSVCVLPNGAAFGGTCSAGTTTSGGTASGLYTNLKNAISAEGDRVFWSASANGPAPIYLRVNPEEPQSAVVGSACVEADKACTYPVSAEAEADSGTSSSRFWAASADGGAAIFTTGTDLYRYEQATKLATKIAGGVSGVMGASEDASRVYFASTEVWAPVNSEGREPAAGEPNLYLYDAAADSYQFIGTVTSEDARSDPIGGRTSAVSIFPFERSSRVSPDGLHAAFMSFAPITGYDNASAASGDPVGEVFLYDASGAGELICASCNPSGSRPRAGDISNNRTNQFFVAASIDGWQNTLYPGRFMADDGSRLYFEAIDALVARDANGVADVYQWEEPGTGSCTNASPTYSDQNRGCVDLISSGQSPRRSEFVDTSPTGEDAFFATLASLAGADYDLVDIYDARVGGGFAPPQAAPTECEGEACQNPASAPPVSVPASALYSGPGNLPPPKAQKKKKRKKATARKRRGCPKGKRKAKRAGKVRCVKASKAKRSNR